ncbi:acyltransferase [Variovorax rhizosphaerae]|uniref:Acyltransferase n=1 Tax=Variovorax rhizosphaerae TaxID=1836200 RepID=A0ABU8WIE5_9BURK
MTLPAPAPSYPDGLAQLSRGRDNNLNLIRMVAATMVLLSHSYVVASGDMKSEPWLALLGMTPGGVAVDAFFVLSGFLVMGSLQRSGRIGPFAVARSLRIYPGLWVALLVSTLVVGAAFSELGFRAFISDPQTWRYLARNATMVGGSEAVLPGAFAHNPFADQVNVSLWTLRWELRLYIALGLMGWCATRWPRGARLMPALVPGLAVTLLATTFILLFLDKPNDAPRLGAMFLSGAAYWIHRDRLRIQGRWALAVCMAMAAGAAVAPHAFEVIYRLGFPYVLMYLAFVPGSTQGPATLRGIRAYNRVGDYSYGMYVYAFPVQQCTAALLPGISTWTMTGVAGAVTLMLAMLSWHLIEKPATSWRRRPATRAEPGKSS